MSEQAMRFAVVLYELGIEVHMVEEAERIFRENPVLPEVLKSPVIPLGKKHRILEKIFSEPEFSPLFLHFLEKACDDCCIVLLDQITALWRKYKQEQEGVMEAELYCVTEPLEKQAEEMKTYLCKRYGKKKIMLHVIHRPELLGGFLLKAGNIEYDYSLAGRMRSLRRAIVK